MSGGLERNLHPLAFCLLQGNRGGFQAWPEGLGQEGGGEEACRSELWSQRG